MLPSIKDVLMNRDGLSEHAANCLIEVAKEEVSRHFEAGRLLSAENAIFDYFALEPDYLLELIEF